MSMVIFIFIVINQFVVYFLRVDYLCKGLLQKDSFSHWVYDTCSKDS
ncbi:hypothetical protein BCLUESOX_1339 [bacterium endosymbiont of Bathymodiolus sp. 5 South]|nr:hypothetical protein [uncultured Gammaproteobacteria bacterium]SHN93978.1 hypothetical protein BCLUESOX_1339 [bacterium endosymbiont of Bathymodiolus sp. 5 South]